MSPEHFFFPFWIWQFYQFSPVWRCLEINFYVGNILVNFQRRGSPLRQIRSFSNLIALLDVNDHSLFRTARGGICLSQEAKNKEDVWNLTSTNSDSLRWALLLLMWSDGRRGSSWALGWSWDLPAPLNITPPSHTSHLSLTFKSNITEKLVNSLIVRTS